MTERKYSIGQMLGGVWAVLSAAEKISGHNDQSSASSKNPLTFSGPPYIITISGHFCAGKDALKDELQAQRVIRGIPINYLINYKERGPRSREIPGIDYRQILQEDFDRLVRDGKIVEYRHDERRYGLAADEFMTGLANGKIPLMITDERGFVALRDYLTTNNVPNRWISFMLHTSKQDAFTRLMERAGRRPNKEEIKGMMDHMSGYTDEIERYKTHEDLFRHVLRSPNLDYVPKEEQIRHTGERVISILDLEGRLNAPTAEDFRALYVEEIVRNLFGSSTSDLIGSANQGIQLPIPRDVVEQYSREHGIEANSVRSAARKRILRATNQYGYLSLYFEPATTDAEKKVLADLINISVGMPYQSRETKIEFTRDSHVSLAKVAAETPGLIDDLISFSPYDPMRVPRQDARIHTIAFHSLKDGTRSTNIEPMPVTEAKKIVEGNGIH